MVMKNQRIIVGPVFKNPFWNETIGRYVLLNNLISNIEKEIEVSSYKIKM